MVSRSSSRSPSTTSVRASVAALLLCRELGQRIPTVQELQATLGAGAGTVVKALRELEDSGAVELEARGRLGTVIVRRSVGRLWNAAEIGNFRLTMPPPGPVEQQGISQAIQESLTRIGIPVVVDFRSGARKRLEEVFHERSHAAVTSTSAFEKERGSLGGLMHIDLGESTYYAQGTLVVIEKSDRPRHDRLRVGIDHNSFDHEELTLAEFGQESPELVECGFVRAPAAVLADLVDVAVWHQLPTVIPPALAGLTVRAMRSTAALQLIPSVSHAAIVTRAIDAKTNAALREVKVNEIRRTQEALAARTDDPGVEGPAFWPR